MAINPQLFQVVFEASNSGMVILGKKGEILHCNRAFRNMSGMQSSTLKSKKLSDFLQDSDQDFFVANFEKLVTGNGKHFQLEVKHQNDQRSPSWWLMELTREIDPNENKRFIFGIVHDVTADKMGRQKLIDEKESAEKATRVKSDFLANMSHEIRTPIHTIIGMNELLIETNLDEEQQEYAQQVKFAADVLLSLINDILDFSKIEAGKLNLETIEFDLHKMVEDAVDLVSLEAHKKGLEAILCIEKGVPRMVVGDPVRLRQIIVNLFNNAIKFTKEGEIVVTIDKKHETDDHYKLFFKVRDTGIGIPRDKLNKLFKAFSQVDTSTTRKFGGTGLGLSISQNLVIMMNGEIGVESEYEEGSTFWFTVQLSKADGKEPTQTIPEDYETVKALVVDDNDTSRGIVKQYLEEWGCQAVPVSNGEDALALLKGGVEKGDPFNLCIVDLLMPGMDGWQFASEVNADKRINSTKMVLLSPTGKSGDEAKMKLLRWYDAYLSKPLKKKELYDCVVRIMGSETDLEAVEELEEISGTGGERAHKKIAQGLILVAEDHEVNQQLFQTILENMGHEVRLAKNGLEALEAAEKENFSVIFMDVQMPEMNGYEATVKIREKGIKTPIIAATASAVKGEQDKCFEVGMDDILIKPFKKRDIEPLLEKWLPEETSDTAPAEPAEDLEPGADLEPAEPVGQTEPEPEPEKPQPGPSFVPSAAESSAPEVPIGDNYIFNYREAVANFMGKEEVVKKVLRSFIEKVENQIPNMEDSLKKNDMEKLRGEAHSIKGGAWNLEVRKLGDCAKELEDSSREERAEDSKRIFKEFRKAYQEFLEFVQPIL